MSFDSINMKLEKLAKTDDMIPVRVSQTLAAEKTNI